MIKVFRLTDSIGDFLDQLAIKSNQHQTSSVVEDDLIFKFLYGR